jgi:spore germination cell wall hydrolase CwlJ-like protein
MIRKFRAGAIAAAATIVVTLFGAEPTGARAEVQSPVPLVQAATPNATDPSAPRFVIPQTKQDVAQTYAAARPAASLSELVDTMPDTDLTGDMLCLAQAIYFEARGEPLDGQLAVGQVVVNRSHSGLYPSDYCSVVTQPAQFSFVRRGVIPQADIASHAWSRAKAVARIAHQELWPSEAKDALFFHAAYVSPSWARRKIQLARIDTHIFYR